jgi:hypothetical protein
MWVLFVMKKNWVNFQNLPELGKHRRQLKLNWHITEDPKRIRLLSSEGLPLNPFGRTGLSGRNTYVKYGANMIFFYVVFAQKNKEQLVSGIFGVN